MNKIVFAPHLDDEVIGCYSIWDEIDVVVYFKKDYREKIVRDIISNKTSTQKFPRYIHIDDFIFADLTTTDTVYLPSKYDFHPLHKEVRNKFLILPCKKMFYSVEMNVPWLEEEKDSEGKLKLLKLLYPGEDLFINNAKYYLFNSIKEYDDICFKQFYLHKYQVRIQNGLIQDLFPIKNIIEMDPEITDEDLYNKIQKIFPKQIIEIDFLTNNNTIK